MNDVKSRLVEFLRSKGLNQSEFGRIIGVSDGYVRSISQSIPPDKLKSIEHNFPELNLAWLLTGTGEMLLYNPKDVTVLTAQNSVQVFTDLPAYASHVSGVDFNQSTERIYIKGYEGCLGFYASGMSMYPTIRPGDLIICRPWTESYVDSSKIYVVATQSGGHMVKRLQVSKRDEDESEITCISDNPDKAKYGNFTIFGSEIAELSVVVLVISTP